MTVAARTAAPPADDRIPRSTRVLAAIIVPFLVAAVALLYVLPSRTDELFARMITPSLSAMMLASAYAGGIWFFMQVVFRRGWHTVAAGFPAVIWFVMVASIWSLTQRPAWDKDIDTMVQANNPENPPSTTVTQNRISSSPRCP